MQGLWTTASLDFEATTRLLRGSEEALNISHKGNLKVSFKPVLERASQWWVQSSHVKD